MTAQEQTDAGAEAWSLLGLALDYGEVTVLPDAIALFDQALADGPATDRACWLYGRGLARGRLAEESDDAAEREHALADLWAAWDALPHPDVSRESLAEDLAHVVLDLALSGSDDDGDAAILDRANTDLDRLAETGSPSVAIARGLVRLLRYRLRRARSDHDEGMALVRRALTDDFTGSPAAVTALYYFALIAADDGNFTDALAAVAQLRRGLELEQQNDELTALEADLLYALASNSDSVATQDEALARLERLCAAANPPPPTSLLGCGELRLFRTVTGRSGDELGSDLEAAIRWLDRALPLLDGYDLAHGHLELGMARNRHGRLAKDSAEHEEAIARLDAALALGLAHPDLTLLAHQERLAAFAAIRDEDAVVLPVGMAEAFATGLAALDAHPDADLQCRAELALELLLADMAFASLRWDFLDIERVQRLIDLAARHPAPPSEWPTMLAAARAAFQGVVDVIGGGSGDAGVALSAEALEGTGQPNPTGELLRRMIGYQSLISASRGDALHSVESARTVFQSDGAIPVERFLAALTDFVLCQQQSGDQGQIMAKVDAVIAAAADVDTQTWDGQLVAEKFLPMLEVMRHISRNDGTPLPALLALVPLNSERYARPVPVHATCSLADEHMDLVRCSVFSTTTLERDQDAIVQVFLYLNNQFDLVASQAREHDRDASHRGFKCLDTEVARGTQIGLHLSARGLEIDTPTMFAVWRGEPTSVQFGVTVPASFAGPSTVIGVMITVAGAPVGHIKFKVVIAESAMGQDTAGMPVGDEARVYRKAFISHASEDRGEVLKRVQILQAVRLDYFQDLLSLIPGEDWMSKISEQIDSCDVFLLFWSTAAKRSQWVGQELERALARKNGDDLADPEIVPVIIEGPPVPAPPAALAHLHFNDCIMSVIAANS